jgi:DedD protein
MASTASSEASVIRRKGRQRLIGAIAIAVLLVVFVPMLLDSETRPPHGGPALDIPNRDKAAPLPPASAPLIPHKPLPPVEKPVTPAEKPVTPVETGAQPKPATAPAAPRLEGFAVQVGAFKDDEKLKEARERLAAAGIPHYTERRDTSGGGLTRLRAGPFPSREAADSALARIKLNAMDGQVVPLP